MPFGTHLLLFKHIRFVPAQKNAENTKGRGSDVIHGLTINSAHRRNGNTNKRTSVHRVSPLSADEKKAYAF